MYFGILLFTETETHTQSEKQKWFVSESSNHCHVVKLYKLIDHRIAHMHTHTHNDKKNTKKQKHIKTHVKPNQGKHHSGQMASFHIAES